MGRPRSTETPSTDRDGTNSPVRIAMWSGPRNISTAMMRAWGARPDTVVMDEPFYGAYLRETGLDHPMRGDILAQHPTDWATIEHACAHAQSAPIVYQKHMCQHMVDAAPLGWMAHVRHAFLIRPPAEVAASFHAKWGSLGPDDLGFRQQATLFDHICRTQGSAPPVIEARDVLRDPGRALMLLCARLGVPYDPVMLSWEPGRRQTDGVWAAHWYGSVEASTGFGPVQAQKPVPDVLSDIIAVCEPHYRHLAVHKISV